MAQRRECFTRARRPDEIAQRQEEIVSAAAALLDSEALDKISLNAIAREAGLAKSAVYRYFESREAIFLRILEQDWRQWLEQVEAALAPLAGSDDPAAVARALTSATVAQPRLCRLVSALSSVLEQNLSEDVVLGFKQESLTLATRMMEALHSALPSIPMNQWLDFANPAIALIAGLWPLSHPSETVRKVMARPEFAPFQPDFEQQLQRTLTLTLRGLLEQSRNGETDPLDSSLP